MLSALLNMPADYRPALDNLQRGYMQYSGISSNIAAFGDKVKRINKPLTNSTLLCYLGYRLATNKQISFRVPLTPTLSAGVTGGKKDTFLNFVLRY